MSFIRKIKRNGRIYLAEVESYREDGKVRQRHLRYLGLDPASDPKRFLFDRRNLDVESVKLYGPVIVLESIARELGLYELLGDIAHPILALTFAHCLNYKSVSETSSWFNKTDLGALFGVSEITEKQLYKAVFRLGEYDFDHIEKSIFEKLSNIFGEDSSGVVYDGTNTSLMGTRSELACKGKSKDGKRGCKLIQIGLGVTKTLGLPIFHQVHAGNIHDTKMFNEAIYRFADMGVRHGLAVFDRGITSENSVSKLHELGWKSLAGMPMHKGIRNAISNLDLNGMKSFRNLIVQGDTKFFVKGLPYRVGQVEGKLIILQNPLKKQDQTIKRMQDLEKVKMLAESDWEALPESILRFFTADKKINHHAVKRAEKYDGLSFLFTNSKLTLRNAVQQYFAKDLIERCFRLSKSVLHLNPIRFQLDQNIKTHVMICYLSLALLTTIRIRLENKGIFSDSSEILKSLDSIFKIYMVGKKSKKKDSELFYKVNTVSKRQSMIIKTIAPNVQM